MAATPGQRLQVVTKELIGGRIGGAVKALISDDAMLYGPGGVVDSIVVDPQGYLGQEDQSPWIHTVDGGGYWHFKYTDTTSSLKAYLACSPVAAVLQRKAQAFINGRTWLLNSQGKEATGPYAKKLLNLLRRPNPKQSQKELDSEVYMSLQLFGWTLIYLPKPIGFKDNIDAAAIYNIPPCVLKIKFIEKPSFFGQNIKDYIQTIEATYCGVKVVLPVEDCYILKDFIPSFGASYLPNSRIQSIETAISNWMGAMDSRHTLINYRGMLGMISQDAGGGAAMGGPLPMLPADKEDLQQQIAKYGLKRGQLQWIITKASLKWTQMGYPTRELMLFEECEADAQLICDAFNYPWRLLSSNTSNSLGGSDADIFTRNLYQDAIIPEGESIYEQWSEVFNLNDMNLRLDKDYSHVPVLQEDKAKQAEGRRTADIGFQIEFYMNSLTLNEWRVHLGEDPIPHGDKYYFELVAEGIPFGPAAAKPITNGQQGQTNADGTPVEPPAATPGN